NIPAEWGGDGKNIAWKLPLPGIGGSTPVVWNDRIFLTSEDGKDVALLCVGTDGKLLWKKRIDAAVHFRAPEDSPPPSASPSTDGKYAYVFVATGRVACYDFEGNEVWQFNAQERYGAFKIQFGMHSTPLLDGERLYLQLIHSGGAWVVALDKATGKE